jgi:hypothetical protein
MWEIEGVDKEYAAIITGEGRKSSIFWCCAAGRLCRCPATQQGIPRTDICPAFRLAQAQAKWLFLNSLRAEDMGKKIAPATVRWVCLFSV